MTVSLSTRSWLCLHLCTGLFISPSGISELDCATTKTDTAERSISIGRESLQVFFFFFGTRGLLLKMEVISSFEMSGITHPMIWYHFLEDLLIPTVLNIGGSGWHHTQLVYPQVQRPQCPVHRRLCSFQSRSQYCAGDGSLCPNSLVHKTFAWSLY